MASELLVNKITPESGTTLTLGDTLYVDSTNNEVGIGTTSPDAKLHIQATAATSGQDLIKLINGADSAELVIDTSANEINFKTGTGDDIVFLPAGTESVRFLDSGNIEVVGQIETKIDGTALSVSIALNDGNTGFFRPADNNIGFATAGVERMRLNSDGLHLGGTTSANALNDYEEGTYTPTIVGTTSAGTGTYTVQDGDYTKIGEVVRINAHLRWSAHTGTGSMEIQNLPFTSGLSGTRYYIPSLFSYNLTLGSGNVITGFMPGNSSKIRLQVIGTGGGTTANLGMDASGEVYATLVYRV